MLSGTAAPDERISVTFAATEAGKRSPPRAVLGMRPFPARRAGGPLCHQCCNGNAAADDVVVGDVWLCSGQSNMEYPLRRALNGDGEVQSANDSDLRLMKVPQQLGASPRPGILPSRRRGSRATPDSAKDFSAACYFLARDLRKTEKVPVGAIDDTWGGTPIRAWMDEASVRASGGADAAAAVDLYRRDPTAAVRQFGAEWGSWWRSKTGDKPGREPWNASGRLAWKAAPSLTYWDSWGPEWKAWIGSAWLRERVALTAAEAAQTATLSLSAVDDMDQTFVNGIAVGGRNDPANARSYPIPKGVLKPGANEIMVFVRNAWGVGGFAGPADKFALTFADGQSKSPDQRMGIFADRGLSRRTALFALGRPAGVSTIYNAMVAPLGPLQVKGVAWYQGEADVGKAGYDRRLAAWMGDWRAQFRDPNVPFLIVGLAGWGERVSHPVESGWAALINEQRLAVERDGRTALASAIDLGEPDDIHPANKQEVGRRLALAAHRLVYRDGGTVGPLPVRATRTAQTISMTFTKPLQVLSGANANAFELCGPAGGTCRYANARVQGSTAVIADDGQAATRVRYAWADYPIVNLYDQDHASRARVRDSDSVIVPRHFL